MTVLWWVAYSIAVVIEHTSRQVRARAAELIHCCRRCRSQISPDVPRDVAVDTLNPCGRRVVITTTAAPSRAGRPGRTHSTTGRPTSWLEGAQDGQRPKQTELWSQRRRLKLYVRASVDGRVQSPTTSSLMPWPVTSRCPSTTGLANEGSECEGLRGFWEERTSWNFESNTGADLISTSRRPPDVIYYSARTKCDGVFITTEQRILR